MCFGKRPSSHGPVAHKQGPKPKAAARSGAARMAVGLWPTITFLLRNEPASGLSVAGGCSILSTFFNFGCA